MKRTGKRLSCLLLCMVLLAVGGMGSDKLAVYAAKNVTPSTKEYEVDLYKANVFLGNEKGVDVSGGEAVYLTYTVSSVAVDTTIQSGLIATADNTRNYPYDKVGIMKFNHLKSLLLKPGYTYFIKFEVTEFGFEYIAVYSNGEDEGYETGFTKTAGTVMDNMQYCGIWIAEGNVSAKLTHVRCYDKAGNDLGVKVKNGMVIDPSFKANPNVKHSYEFSVSSIVAGLAISNAKHSKATDIFMEYEVKDVKDTIKQTGFIVTSNPTTLYPYDGNAGYMQFFTIYNDKSEELAIPGAKYLIRFTKAEEGLTVTARYTLDGRDHYITFPNTIGAYDSKYGYCSLWFATGELSATFYNVKCYDGDGNNLGIQTNQSGVEIIHYGGWEDYSVCEAMYYCSDNDTLITLLKDCSASVKKLGEGTTEEGTYRIDERQLTMQAGGQSAEYEYSYIHMTDESGNQYDRLKEYTVKFVTGTEEIIETASMENSYQIEVPENPTMKGNTFKGWYLGDGTEYTASDITTESQTVYAKWADGDGNEYLATGVEVEQAETDMTPIVIIGFSTVLVLLTAIGILLVIMKGRKYVVK